MSKETTQKTIGLLSGMSTSELVLWTMLFLDPYYHNLHISTTRIGRFIGENYKYRKHFGFWHNIRMLFVYWCPWTLPRLVRRVLGNSIDAFGSSGDRLSETSALIVADCENLFVFDLASPVFRCSAWCLGRFWACFIVPSSFSVSNDENAKELADCIYHGFYAVVDEPSGKLAQVDMSDTAYKIACQIIEARNDDSRRHADTITDTTLQNLLQDNRFFTLQKVKEIQKHWSSGKWWCQIKHIQMAVPSKQRPPKMFM